ncbi:hypothetical protein K438DRAFT_1767490 [Mycena galopus ATCC 62051]|nr:hypothetical protein K438DRAFT_1767490 [Mycena galopus ATCC 62051]
MNRRKQCQQDWPDKTKKKQKTYPMHPYPQYWIAAQFIRVADWRNQLGTDEEWTEGREVKETAWRERKKGCADYETLGQASAALEPNGLHCLLEKCQKKWFEVCERFTK